MRKALFGITFVFISLVIVFLLGPRPVIDTETPAISLPEDLEAYLLQSEERFTDITPGAEKTIIWANADKSKTPVSIIYLHGFSATRQETAPLCDNLAKQLGANLFYTRYSGHGRTGEPLAQATVNDWFNDTLEAFEIGKRLGEKVIVVSTSTGGTLATWLALQPPTGNTLCHVMISPNYALYDSRSEILTYPWGAQFAQLIVGKEFSFQPVNEEQAKYWTCRYPSVALVTMMSLVKEVRKADLGQFTAPVLVIYSPRDKVVDPLAVEQSFARFGSSVKELQQVNEIVNADNHVLAGDIRAPEFTPRIEEMILEFTSKL